MRGGGKDVVFFARLRVRWGVVICARHTLEAPQTKLSEGEHEPRALAYESELVAACWGRELN